MDSNSTKNLQGWLLPEQTKKQRTQAGLYLIATPIGNLADMSIRALDILAGVGAVFCEDTRVSGKLMKAYGLSVALKVYNDHSRADERAKIVDMMVAGKSIALISDAGTPLIADPGYKLVQDCYAAGVYVSAVPGANAPLTALQLSGLPSDCFSFIGFLPSKEKARQDVLARWKAVPSTLVMFEAAPRLLKSLADIRTVLGGRRVSVVREMTKLYEQVSSGLIDDVIAGYEGDGLPKGEIVIVVEPPLVGVKTEDDIRSDLAALLLEMRVKDAVSLVAEQSDWSKKDVYELALSVKKDL